MQNTNYRGKDGSEKRRRTGRPDHDEDGAIEPPPVPPSRDAGKMSVPLGGSSSSSNPTTNTWQSPSRRLGTEKRSVLLGMHEPVRTTSIDSTAANTVRSTSTSNTASRNNARRYLNTKDQSGQRSLVTGTVESLSPAVIGTSRTSQYTVQRPEEQQDGAASLNNFADAKVRGRQVLNRTLQGRSTSSSTNTPAGTIRSSSNSSSSRSQARPPPDEKKKQLETFVEDAIAWTSNQDMMPKEDEGSGFLSSHDRVMHKDESLKSLETTDPSVYRPPTFFRYAVPIETNHSELAQPVEDNEDDAEEPKSSVRQLDSAYGQDVDAVVPVATLVHTHSAKVLAQEVEDTPWYQRGLFWIIVCIVLAAVLAIGLVVGLGGGDDRSSTLALGPSGAPTTSTPTPKPTPPPTPEPTTTINPELFYPNVPLAFQRSFNSTLEWFGADNIPFESKTLQRFILTWFYYHTTDNGQSPWIVCNPSAGNITSEIDNSTDTCMFFGVSKNIGSFSLCIFLDLKATWLSEADECRWAGISCNEDGRVTEINLPAIGIRGPFPYFLSGLSYLTSLDLSYGAMTGELPPELGNFESLTTVNLAQNLIHGTLPTSLFSSRVSTLDLSSNRLNESLPIGIENIFNLRLSGNYLPGPLPDVGSAGNLEVLDLSRQNKAMENTTIPSTWGLLTDLSVLDLSRNGMRGVIPVGFENLRAMQVLNLDSNSFHGFLPSMPWPNLRSLSVQNNAFNGTFPDSI